jgi:hypothetical protein
MDTLFPVEAQLNVTSKTRPLTQTGSLQIYLQLAENTLFVQGFDSNEYKSRPPTLLRGALVVRVLKTAKLKTITLSLKGVARTEWPEGIPPKRQDTLEENDLINHTWPFFSNSHTPGADLIQPLQNDSDDVIALNLDAMSIRSSSNGPGPSALSVFKRVTSPSPNRARSTSIPLFSTFSSDHHDTNEIFTFSPGDYIYNFEHPIPASTPETIDATFGSVSYELQVLIERYGAFKSNISTSLPINIVRAPSEESVEDSEPIAINKDWEDQLHYEIVVASKSIILNAYIPIALKLIPLDKIKLHRIKIYLTESMEYYCKNKKVHRMEPTKKHLLLEHKAPPPPDLPSDADSKKKKMGNLLTSDGYDITAKEFEFQVYVPEKLNNRASLHPNTSYANIKVHHWIKICLRLSRVIDGKPKHYEISIDSPIHVLNQLCSHANTLLPAYGIPNFDSSTQNHDSNIYFPRSINTRNLLSPELSPEVTPVEQHSSLSAVLNHPSANRSRSSSSLMNSLSNFESTLSANIYKPDNIQSQLTSPQALPVSPIASPLQRPIHLLRRPSFDPPGFDEDVSPPPLSRLPFPTSPNQGGIDSTLDFESTLGLDATLRSSLDRSFTPLNSPPPVTISNGVREEDIPMDPPTYEDFLELDGMMSPFLYGSDRVNNRNDGNIPEVTLTTDDNNDLDEGDLGDFFKFKGGFSSMPASVMRSTSPMGQRIRGSARSPRASFEYRRSEETIDNVLETEPAAGVDNNNDNNGNSNNSNSSPYNPGPAAESAIDSDEEEGEIDPLTRFSSASSVSPQNLIPHDSDNHTLFIPLLHRHSNSTQVSFDQQQQLLQFQAQLQRTHSRQQSFSTEGFRDRFESRDSLLIRREPSSVDITSLYSHANPFVVPNVSNIVNSNVASQRQHSISHHSDHPMGASPPVSSGRPAYTRQSSIQSLNPILAVLDDDDVEDPISTGVASSQSCPTNRLDVGAIEEEESDGKKSESSSILDPHRTSSSSTVTSSVNNTNVNSQDTSSLSGLLPVHFQKSNNSEEIQDSENKNKKQEEGSTDSLLTKRGSIGVELEENQGIKEVQP